jgi:dodecin
MDDHVYRITEIVGSSSDSLDSAIRNGIDRAGQTLRNLDWFEVSEIRGSLHQGSFYFQVTMKVGFRLEEPE